MIEDDLEPSRELPIGVCFALTDGGAARVIAKIRKDQEMRLVQWGLLRRLSAR